jgi:hypothetical protein
MWSSNDGGGQWFMHNRRMAQGEYWGAGALRQSCTARRRLPPRCSARMMAAALDVMRMGCTMQQWCSPDISYCHT